jgi:hypothetical protein
LERYGKGEIYMKQPPEKAPLNWDVFVTPGIPIVTPDRLAEIQQT